MVHQDMRLGTPQKVRINGRPICNLGTMCDGQALQSGEVDGTSVEWDMTSKRM